MKIIRVDTSNAADVCTVTRLGGEHDGLRFTSVRVELDDGTSRHFWISSEDKKFYKQVFVPWNFNHSKIIE